MKRRVERMLTAIGADVDPVAAVRNIQNGGVATIEGGVKPRSIWLLIDETAFSYTRVCPLDEEGLRQ